MQRRTFLSSTLAASALTATAIAQPEYQSQPEAANTPRKPFVVKTGEARFGEKTKLFGTSPNDIKVSAKDTGGNLTIFEYNGQEKGGPPMHIHPHQDEIFYILVGQYRFQVGDEKHELTAGDAIFMPRNVPHTFAQLSDSGRMIFFLQPDSRMEDYFREVGKLTPKTVQQEGPKLFASHDMQVVGPPLHLND